MKKALLVLAVMLILLIPSRVPAVETAPRITDREIIERLTRLEEGQNTLRAEIRANAEAIRQLREDMSTQIQQLRADMNQLREEMKEQNRQLREDMNAQFDRIDAQFNRVINIMVGIVLAFAGIVATTIGFAFWDRRTMIRPFESKVREMDEEISQNRQRFHSLLEALRALSQTDDKVAEVLKRFNLL